MATPDPRELQRLIKQLTDIQDKIKDIGGTPVKVNFEGKTAEDVAKEFGSAKDAIGQVKSALRNAQGELNNLLDGSAEFADLTKAIREEFTKLPSGLNATRASFRKINGYAQELTEMSADILKTNVKDVRALREKTALEFKRAAKRVGSLEQELTKAKQLQAEEEAKYVAIDKNDKRAQAAQLKRYEAAKEAAQELEAATAAAKDQVGLAQAAEEAYSGVEKRLKTINQTAGLTTGLLGGLGAAFEKVGFGGLAKHFEAGSEAATEFADRITEGGTRATFLTKTLGNLGSLFVGLGKTATSALGSILSPQGLLISGVTLLLKQFGHVDHAVSNVGKTLGLSRQSAHEMTMQIKSAAAASGDTFLNMDRMLDAQLALNKELGTNVMLTNKQLGDQTRLTEFVGLQADQLGNVYRSSLITGKSQEDLYNSVVDTNDSIFSSVQLFQEAAGVTGQIAMNLGNNPATIAQAVAETKRLGITLDQARGMSNSILDFENSIAAEMEAQVLTGKAINLNRARELAFAGDIEGAASEMLRQVGGINEFQNMNVLAQQSLAEAMGMTVDELSNQLVQRAANEKIAKRQRELELQGISSQEAQLMALRENQTVSERLGNAFAKIGDFVGGIIAPAVEFVADNLEVAMGFFGGLFGHSKGVSEEVEKMQPAVASAVEEGKNLASTFQPIIGFVKSIGTGLKTAFDTVKDSPVLKVLTGLVGGVALFKGAKNIFQGKGLFGQKLGASASNPMFVTVTGGGPLSNISESISSSIGKTFKGKLFKGLSSVVGGKKTMAGRALRGVAAKSMGGGLAGKALGGAVKAGGKGVAKAGGKGIAKLGAKALGKAALKKIPGIGLLAGIGFGLQRALKGDLAGAALELASGGASMIPGLGTAASVAIDAGLAARDISKSTTPQPSSELQSTPETINAADVTLRTLPEDTLAFAGGTQFGKETNDLLRQLIAAVNQGGDVMLDGVKVGNTLALSSYKL